LGNQTPCEGVHKAFPRKRPRPTTAGQELIAALSQPVPADAVLTGLRHDVRATEIVPAVREAITR
jgi:hypothetical protein